MHTVRLHNMVVGMQKGIYGGKFQVSFCTDRRNTYRIFKILTESGENETELEMWVV